MESRAPDFFLKTLWERFQQRKNERSVVRKAIEDLVEIADPGIRGISRYWKPLRSPVTSATAYCSSLLEVIPGPLHLSRDNYHDNPIVNALFPSAEALEDFLRICPELSAFRRQGPVSGTMMALMTMSREEKTIYDYRQEGDTVMRDVAQRAVNFSDHRLVAPALDLDASRQGVVDRGLEVLATIAMEQIETLQGKKAELQQRKAYLKAALRILGGKAHMLEVFASPEPGKWEEYRKTEKFLAEVENELAKVDESIGRPEQSLDHLSAILRSPEKALTAQQQNIRLDWKNVRVENLPDAKGNEITFAEFAIPDVMERSAVFVSFAGSSIHSL